MLYLHTAKHSNIYSTQKYLDLYWVLMFQCSYAACYCEENVYKICEAMLAHHSGGGEAELGKASVVFVSNKKRVVPLWRQKAGRDEEKLVIWDYHVILIYRPDHRRDTVLSVYSRSSPVITSHPRLTSHLSVYTAHMHLTLHLCSGKCGPVFFFFLFSASASLLRQFSSP